MGSLFPDETAEFSRRAHADSQSVIDSIRQIVHALELGSHAAQRTVGLSGAQLFVLQTLAQGEAMSINELAAKSFTHQSSVSVVVSRLVKAKLLRRAKSREDARRVELTVTAAGRKVLKTDVVLPQQRLIQALSYLPAAQLRQLRLLLKKVTAASGMDGSTPPMFLEKNHKK